MRSISYAKFQKKYADEYIARKESKVLAHAKTYIALTKKLDKMNLDRSKLVIGFVPPKNIICIYNHAR